MNHLGGHNYVTHIDEGALKSLLSSLPITSMLDIGCGVGGMEKIATSLNISWTGIDGDPSITGNHIVHDFTISQYDAPLVDLVWCIEFVEHVEERYIPNYLPALTSCNTILITAAPPGSGGYHHVNERSPEYWKGVLASRGMKFCPRLTKQVRKASTMDRHFIRNRGLVFTRSTRREE